jgi:1-acyl-sn-glycerol-3-phosphate acyltransferase
LFYWLTTTLLAIFSLLLLVLSLLIYGIPIHILALLKLLLYRSSLQKMLADVLETLYLSWIRLIITVYNATHRVDWDIRGLDGLETDQWYLVNANHQAWTDIPVLYQALTGRIPVFKFFIKREMLWVPIVGVAAWAFDYPFMKRYSGAYLKRHPEKRGIDLETTRKACEHYKSKPVSILNFCEGTRFTPDKHRRQQSPYRHLLNPRAGGIAFAVSVMEGRIKDLVDVTIVYPGGTNRLWDFLAGRITRVVVYVRCLALPPEFLAGDYLADPEYRARFQEWVNALWKEKDDQIDEILNAETPKGV